ncbi:peptidoglycan DD-metalloendopeptidase family protein [Candidatus Dojkabacteria bacterium]|uniref:Peptidoglycan DD-metalloendopeptidase family protein n=1 Tax=Candidatus Dojkabacteria bacterium TaxID=2099670 RepID=A0A955L7K4_9BACT|nr:peptidoglycan DD-metalloendopeptidase family protein [Candidatus Dojkabacteria bacterium]
MKTLIELRDTDPPSRGRIFHYPTIRLLTIFTVVLFSLFTLSLTYPVFAREDTSLRYLQERGAISKLRTDSPITRGEAIKILTTLDETTSQKLPACSLEEFKDISNEHLFAPFICEALEQNLTNGYLDNTFRPDELLTFDSAAKFIMRKYEPDPSEKDFFGWLNHRNAIPLSIECAQDEITRSEFADIVMRIDSGNTSHPTKPVQELKDCSEVLQSPLSHPSCENSYYISRGWSYGHTGVDFPLRADTSISSCPIVSIGDGKILRAEYGRSLGNFVVIEHKNGLQSLYAHMGSDLKVSAGDTVKRGEEIGMMGCSGYCFGTHLHFSISKHSNVVNRSNRVNPSGIVPY